MENNEKNQELMDEVKKSQFGEGATEHEEPGQEQEAPGVEPSGPAKESKPRGEVRVMRQVSDGSWTFEPLPGTMPSIEDAIRYVREKAEPEVVYSVIRVFRRMVKRVVVTMEEV